MNKFLIALLALFGLGIINNSYADVLNYADLPQNFDEYYQSMQKSYGEGDEHKYFEFQKDDSGNRILKEVDKLKPDSRGITFNYSLDNLSKDRIIAVKNGVDYTDGLYLDFINFKINDNIAYGGAVTNRENVIGRIESNFVNNYAVGEKFAQGGAIRNYSNGIINGGINGGFINNYSLNNMEQSMGGAIYNAGKITGIIDSKFIANKAIGTTTAIGGALYNSGEITGSITSDFVNNYAKAQSGETMGGAIYNIGTLTGDINGNFVNNGVYSRTNAYGGAIANAGIINGNIFSDFIENAVISDLDCAQGAAIRNFSSGIINGGIKGNFIGNYTQSFEKAHGIDALGHGGTIFNAGKINNIEGVFINNYSKGEKLAFNYGGAINNYKGEIDSISAVFYSNSTSTTLGNSNGGAIRNYNGTINSIQGAFLNNHTDTTSGIAQGGAIYSNRDINITADSNTPLTLFKNNHTNNNGKIENNAIFMEITQNTNNDPNFIEIIPTLTLSSTDNSKIIMCDSIDGTKGYNLKLTGDNTGTIQLFNKISNAGNLTIENGINIDMIDNKTHDYSFDSITLNNNANLGIDIDLNSNKSDRILINENNNKNTLNNPNNNKITINNINIISDSPLPIAKLQLSNNDELNKNIELSLNNETSKKYNIEYDNTQGKLIFTKTGGNKYSNYTPNIFAAPIAAQLGGYLTQLNTYEEAFLNMDAYMMLTKSQRELLKQQRKLNELNNKNFNNNNPKYASTSLKGIIESQNKNRFNNNTGYFRPYISIEKIPLKQGPKVNNTMYGSHFGTEFKIKELKNDWDLINGLYITYNGSHQTYDNTSIYQNGAAIGLNSMLYKNNFFQGLTANIGANAISSDSIYSKDNFSLLRTGIASKTGYNIEFKQGKLILQPNINLSYSFINTFNYTNDQNIKISQKPLHAIHIAPELKFISNLQNNTLQPYAAISMNFNILDKTNFNANDISMPDLSIKPYVKYGLGIQKTIKERFQGFFQTYLTHGGRNGIGFQLGVSVMLGK